MSGGVGGEAVSADRLERIKYEDSCGLEIGRSDFDWLVAEVERYREALRQVTHYDVEANHGPTDEWAEAEAFAEASEIAARALYYWEKKEQSR